MKRPEISFATVQWPLDDTLDMVKATTERRFEANIRKAVQGIIDEGSFLPSRVWLVPEEGTLDDPDAVAVYFPTARGVIEVGLIAKRAGKLYRRQLELIGLKDEPIEVLGYISGGQQTRRPLVHVYLPADFDQFYETGYHKDPANHPAWLLDTSPVQKRPLTKKDGTDFTPDELRKVYCWYAKREGWKSLPDGIEQMLTDWTGDEQNMVGLAIRAFDSNIVAP